MPADKRTNRPPADWLVYWRPGQIAAAVSDRLLIHAASQQLGKVTPGDAIWISGRGHSSNLVLIGPIRVAQIVGLHEARRLLPYEPWDAKYHALADPSKAAFAREVPLTAMAGGSRFVSPRRERLDLQKPFGQQLQAIRQLTPASADRLRELWGQEVATKADEFAKIQAELDSLDTLDEKVTIVRRREQSLLRELLFGANKTGTCAICEATLPIGLLVAAHIKPRSACTEGERRDFEKQRGANVRSRVRCAF